MEIHSGLSDDPRAHRFQRQAGFPLWTLGLLEEGSSRFDFSDGVLVQRATAIVLMPPDTPYHLSWGGEGDRWRSLALLFAPSPPLRRRLTLPRVLGGVMGLDCDAAHAPLFVNAFHRVHALVHGDAPLRAALIEHTLAGIMLLGASQTAGAIEIDPLVRQAADILADDLGTHLALPTVARRCGCSLSSLAHRFSRTLGISPARYRERCRMQAAQFILLQSDRPVQEIAAELGYEDPFHFSRRFRGFAGCSPSAYRREHGIVQNHPG